MPRIGEIVWIDTQFDFYVRREGVVLGQFFGDAAGRLRTQSLVLVDLGQFLKFSLRGLEEFLLLLLQECAFGIPLSADRDVLAQRHGHSAGNQSSKTGCEDC